MGCGTPPLGQGPLRKAGGGKGSLGSGRELETNNNEGGEGKKEKIPQSHL